MTDQVVIDLDDEIIFHLAIPESVAEFRTEQVSTELIFDQFAREVFAWQMNHFREHGQAATAAVLEDEFDGFNDTPVLELFDPETAIGDLIKRLRERYIRYEGKKAVNGIADSIVSEPLDVAHKLMVEGRRLANLTVSKGEVYGTGDFDRAWDAYVEQANRGAGPSVGYDEIDGHFHGLRGLTYCVATRKSFKALALDTPIPTPGGWMTMDELNVGDVVFDENGRQCNIVGKSPVYYDRPCYRVTFSDGVSLVADEDHLWETRTRIPDRVEVRTTKDIKESLTCGTRKDRNHSIPVPGYLDCETKDLLIDPYLLGAWIGDGTSADGAITIADDQMVGLVSDCGYEVRKWPSAEWVYGILGLRVALRTLGVLGNKHIPGIYLRASYEQRLSLLQGWMDSDGTCTDRGDCVLVTTNPGLRDEAIELIRSLGLKPTTSEYRAMIYDKDCGPKWHIRFTAFSDQRVFRLDRKYHNQKNRPERPTRSQTRQIVSVDLIDTVPVQCISVDSKSHLYLAGEGMVPTHNSWITVNSLVQNVRLGIPCYLYCLELPALESYWRCACLAANLPFWKYIKGKLMPADKKKVQDAAEELDASGLFYHEKPPAGSRGVQYMVERALDKGAGCIYFDQLQYIETQKGRSIGSLNDTAMYWEVCNDLRDYSDQVPLWIVHQFNRSVMHNVDEFPDSQQGKGSSAVEETATLELGLWASQEMRKNRVLQFGTLESRNHDKLHWHIEVELNTGCAFNMIGEIEEDEEDGE